MTENKVIVFDMDGTIADLYGVDGWLKDLRAENRRTWTMPRTTIAARTTSLIS